MTVEGQILDNTYRLVRLVAEGGMGLVYEATHARLAGRYAIKVLPQKWSKDPEAMARFDREARITSSLQHPNIVQIIDFNTAADGTEYLVMEYLRGETLAARLARLGSMSLDSVVGIVEQIACGLAAAHAHGIVHRDLKPENVLLMRVEGREGEWVKILDFGISKLTNARLGTISPVSKSLIGTPQYMAPEQCEGQTKDVSAATDQFALAVITYEMLTGRPPFAGESIGDVLFRVLHDQPPPMNIDRGVESVVRRGLAKSRYHRYPSITAFAETLRAAAGSRRLVGHQTEESGSHAYSAGEIDRMNLEAPSRRRHWAAVLVAAAVVTVATAFVVGTARTRRPTTPAPATAAFPSRAPVVRTTSTVLPQPRPPPVPEIEPMGAPPSSSPMDRGASDVPSHPRNQVAAAVPAGEGKRAPGVRATVPGARAPVRRKSAVARASATRTPAAVARVPAPRAAAPAARAPFVRSMTTSPARPPTIDVPTSMPPRRPTGQVGGPQPQPSRPLPADEDATLPLDERFNAPP